MKLRSGTLLPYTGKKELPIVLQEKLDSTLIDFKELLIEHERLAKEVLKMITEAHNFETVYKIDRMLKNNEIPDGTRSLGGTCGSLVGLVIGNHNFYIDQKIEHIYHDEIKERMLSFLETSLVGDQINHDEMGI